MKKLIYFFFPKKIHKKNFINFKIFGYLKMLSMLKFLANLKILSILKFLHREKESYVSEK